jgi:hypothetical protein
MRNTWDIAWKIEGIYPEINNWRYAPDLFPGMVYGSGYYWIWYAVITANIYRWTQVTE